MAHTGLAPEPGTTGRCGDLKDKTLPFLFNHFNFTVTCVPL